MITFDFGKLFIPTELPNTEKRTGNIKDRRFNTCDKVYLDVAQFENKVGRCTDYAVMCGAYNRNQKASYWYRTGRIDKNYIPYYMVHCNTPWGKVSALEEYERFLVLRPVMCVAVDTFLQYRDFLARLGNTTATQIHKMGNLRQVTFGLEFPSEHPEPKICKNLEKNRKNGMLRKTTSTYFGYYDNMYGDTVRSTEYEYFGEKYVRIAVKPFNETKDPFYGSNMYFHEASRFNDNTKCPAAGKSTWAKVEPIYFTIRNWDDLPHSINPQGTGKANYLDVIADRGIITMPFSLRFDEEALWQNSVPRAYLNGYNLHQEINLGNGNRKHMADKDVNHDYSGEGFLYEASQNLRARYMNITILEDHEPHNKLTDKSGIKKLTTLRKCFERKNDVIYLSDDTSSREPKLLE